MASAATLLPARRMSKMGEIVVLKRETKMGGKAKRIEGSSLAIQQSHRDRGPVVWGTLPHHLASGLALGGSTLRSELAPDLQ
jgi:hypothetical protein